MTRRSNNPSVLVDDTTGQLKYVFGTDGTNFLLGTPAGDGLIDWINPATLIPATLVGDPIIISGTTFTPQIQARLTGANQFPFYSVHAATDFFGSFDFMGSYRGTLPASLSFLQTGDNIRNIAPLCPYSGTEWGSSANIGFVVSSNHSAGVNPVDINIVSAQAGVTVQAAGQLALTGASILVNGDVDCNDDLTVNGNVSIGLDLDVDGDAVVRGDFNAEGAITTLGAGAGDSLIFNATANQNLIFGTGYGLHMEEGTNGTAGLATLVAGTVTVNTTAFTAQSRVLLTVQTAGGAQGFLSIANPVAGTSFDILSTSATETSVVYWIIFES